MVGIFSSGKATELMLSRPHRRMAEMI